MGSSLERGLALAIGAAVVTLGFVGCTHVKQDAFDQEMADLRSTLDDHDRRIGENASAIQGLEGRVSALESDLEDLRRNFQARITELENGLRFTMPVHFEFDRAEIRAVDRPILDRFAAVISNHYDGSLVTVEGFADPAGSQAYNVRLSQRRAEAVKRYLVENAGLSAERIKAVGYGEVGNRLVRPGEQGPGRSGLENRRVTFVVDFGGNLGG